MRRTLTVLLSLALIAAACSDNPASTPATPATEATAEGTAPPSADTAETPPAAADDSATAGDSGTTEEPATEVPATIALSPEGQAALERLVDGFLFFLLRDRIDPADIFFPSREPTTVGGETADDVPAGAVIRGYARAELEYDESPVESLGDASVYSVGENGPGRYFAGVYAMGGPIDMDGGDQVQFGVAFRSADRPTCDAPGEPYDGASFTVIIDFFSAGSIFGLECVDGAFTVFPLEDVFFAHSPTAGADLLLYGWRLPGTTEMFEANPWSFFRPAAGGFALENGRFHRIFEPTEPWFIVNY